MEVLELLLNEDLIFLSFMLIMGGSFLIIAVAFPLWFVMHRLLEPLDPVLLREPFFPKWDQPNWQVWPVSYLKTLTYVCLIAVPGIAMRKRFKGLDQVPKVRRVTRVLAKTHFYTMCLGVMMGIIHLAYFGLVLWISPHLFN